MELKKIIIAILTLICLAISPQLKAQQTIVKASIDSTSILIGEQTFFHLEVVTNKGETVQLPTLVDTLTAGVGILGASQPVTKDIGNNRIQVKQDYLVTSFDSALYIIPGLKVVAGSDTILSNNVVLKVSTYQVESDDFYDIKDTLKPPFVLSDYYFIIYGILGTLLLFCIVMYILQKRKKAEPILSFKKKEPDLPPHIKAIMHLDEIKSEKLWQQGKMKEYHTEITDVLRKYIEDRFGINALEMTSEEIVQQSYKLSEADSARDSLKYILQLADFVKFAKYNPLPEENEMSLMNSYLFVNQTKKEEKPVIENEDNELNLKAEEQKIK